MVLSRIAVIALVGLIAACASEQSTAKQQKSRFELAYERFQSHLDQCTAIHKTDPRSSAASENELVPREREWRACAYEGIRTLLVPESSYPEVYAQLIVEDQAMTEQVASGEMTRSERRARLDEIREEIAAKEARATDRAPSEAEHNAALVRQIRGLP